MNMDQEHWFVFFVNDENVNTWEFEGRDIKSSLIETHRSWCGPYGQAFENAHRYAEDRDYIFDDAEW